MSGAVRELRRRAAKRPEPRTVHVVIEEGDFAGWEATVRADFPASLMRGFESGRLDDILAVMELIITEHNMPNGEDEIAEHLADVDPYAGLLAIANEIGAALGKLPNR